MIVLGVLGYLRYDLLGKFLMSVERGSVVADRIIVVDNGSKFREKGLGLSERTQLVEPGRNLGVSGGWNTIVEIAVKLGAERVVIANDDIELYPETLEQVLAVDADIVRAPGYSFFAMRPQVVERIGWFDENYWPGYHEDLDHARRATLSGKVSIADPQGLRIDHVGSASIHSLSVARQAVFGVHFTKGQKYYAKKWGGLQGHECFDVAFNGSPPPGWQERPITVGGSWPDEPWLR